MKNLLKNKNICSKNVNNHKTIIYHKFYDKYHMLSKGYERFLGELTPVYQDIENDFDKAYLIDLKFYERWLDV